MPDVLRARQLMPVTGPAPRFRRRVLLRTIAPLLLAPALVPASVAAAAAAADAPATMLVGGPRGGRLDRWSAVLTDAIRQFLPTGAVMRREVAGGADGVTAANQFSARVAPDGQTVLLLPGAAFIAWLAGDPRAQFDAAQWVPVMSGVTPGVVVSRVGATAIRGGGLRVAVGTASSGEVAALLGVELLGGEPVAVSGLGDAAAAAAAFSAGAVDAVLIHGEDVAPRVAALGGAGGRPLFVLGAPDGRGELGRDPDFSTTPSLPELLRDRGDTVPDDLFAGWCAVAAAVQLDFSLVLPQLAPAAMVSVWRRAAAQASSSPALLAASADGVRPIAAPAPDLPTIVTSSAALLALRRWLSERLHWQPA